MQRLARLRVTIQLTIFSGVITDGNRKSFIFPVQLTTSRIGNHTRLIHTLLKVVSIHTVEFTLLVSCELETGDRGCPRLG